MKEYNLHDIDINRFPHMDGKVGYELELYNNGKLLWNFLFLK